MPRNDEASNSNDCWPQEYDPMLGECYTPGDYEDEDGENDFDDDDDFDERDFFS